MTNPFHYFKTSPEIIRLAVMPHVHFPLWVNNTHFKLFILSENDGKSDIQVTVEIDRLVSAYGRPLTGPKFLYMST